MDQFWNPSPEDFVTDVLPKKRVKTGKAGKTGKTAKTCKTG
jgi:hypothetical protein